MARARYPPLEPLTSKCAFAEFAKSRWAVRTQGSIVYALLSHRYHPWQTRDMETLWDRAARVYGTALADMFRDAAPVQAAAVQRQAVYPALRALALPPMRFQLLQVCLNVLSFGWHLLIPTISACISRERRRRSKSCCINSG